MIAEAARKRLIACMSHPEDGIDVPEAQGMFEALIDAQLLAKDAEDRVLLHRGLLTHAEVEKRTARRHPVSAPPGEPERPPKSGLRLSPARLLTAALLLALAVAVGVALARGCGVRLPLARR